MAKSTKENPSLITGNLVKAILPSDDRKFKKIVLKINSKIAQIGDANKIIGLEIPRSRTEADEFPNVRCLNFNNESECKTSMIFIQAHTVQLDVGGNQQIEIEVNPNDACCLQIGDQCKIHLQDDSKEEVNRKVDKSSACGRELFEPSRDDTTKPVTRSKRKWNRKPTGKLSSNKIKSKKPTKTAPIDRPHCLELCHKFFEKVQKILHPLRDNGKWSLFDEKWNELMVKYGDDGIWKALLMLEHGIRIYYHSNFLSKCQSSGKGQSTSRENSLYLEEAEKTLQEGWSIVKSLKDIDLSIKQFFEGRFYCYLTPVYRKNKLFGRAQKSIDRAEQKFQNTDPTLYLYDKASVFYEKGSLYHEFDKKGVNKREAKESFEKCYELCQQLKRETGCDIIEKGYFAKLKKVLVLLGCCTKQGRKRKITDEDLEEAKKCITEIENQMTQHSIPVSENLQLLLAKSDKYFRMQDFIQARELAHQAIILADLHGFDSRPAKNRLQDIQDAIKEPWPIQVQNHNKGNVETVDHRASCDADGSGSQTTGSSD